MPDRLRTDSIKKDLEEMTFKSVMTYFEHGLIDEEQFMELMNEVDDIQNMSFEDIHQLFESRRGEK